MKYLLLLLSVNSFAMGSKTFCKYFPKHESCKPKPDPEPTPEPEPTPDPIPDPEPEPEPDPEPTPQDFDWSKVKKYGGNEIGLAKDIASWPITRTFKLKGISGNKLNSSIDGKAYEPAIDGLSGTFNACVKQDDGMYICGSWDYCRASYQTVKTLANLEEGGEMAHSFNLEKGSEICFFYSGLARSSKKNVKERTNLVCTEWK
jgi:hypothetical protein